MPVAKVKAKTTNEAIEKVRNKYRGTQVAVGKIFTARRVDFEGDEGIYRVSFTLKRGERFR